MSKDQNDSSNDAALESRIIRSRVTFCWHCGRKLWASKGIEVEIEGHTRTLHKQCKEDIESGRNKILDGSYE